MLDRESIELLQQHQAIGQANKEVMQALSKHGMLALPSDFNEHDLEKYMPLRRRARGVMSTNVVEDFAAYIRDHKHEGASVFVNGDEMKAVAVLNLGTPAQPGHADDKAILEMDQTAAYVALRGVSQGMALKQVQVAEFLEDWDDLITCGNEDGYIATRHAIAAVRKLTIESMRKVEASEQQLSATKSAFESVTATSADPIPTSIAFKCVPFKGLPSRNFVMRLAVVTSSDKPMLTLRIIKLEEHKEEMARELAGLVREAIAGDVPVLIGSYSTK